MRTGPLRHRWFALFTGSVASGSIGDEIARLALPLLVLDLTHDIAAAALLRVVQTVPYVLFGAFAGALIDRVDKRRLLAFVTIGSILLTVAVPLSVSAGVFSLTLLLAIAFGLGVLELLYGITSDFSVVPALVDEHELTSANSIYLTADRSSRIVGPTLGGYAVAAFAAIGIAGPEASAYALWLSAIFYVPSLVVFLRMPPLEDVDRSTLTRLTPTVLRSEIGEGFAFIWRSRMLRALLVLMFVSNLGGAGIQTLLLFVLREEYRLSAETIGLALSIAGVVSILGSALAPRIASGRPLGHTMLGVVMVAAVVSGGAALARSWQLVIAAVAARQLAWAAHIVYAFLPRQREVPARMRGRVNGSFRTIVLISNSASPALLSVIATARGTSVAFAAAGVLGFLAVLVTYFSPLREYDLPGPRTEEQLAAVESAAEAEPTAAD